MGTTDDFATTAPVPPDASRRIRHIHAFGGIAGETVNARSTKGDATAHTRGVHHVDITDVVHLATPSYRAKPPCEHFGVCGGCSLQHVTPAQQVVLKQQALMKHLREYKIPTDDVTVDQPLMDSDHGYRHSARWSVKWMREGFRIGFRQRSPSMCVDIVALHPSPLCCHGLILR